MNFREIIKSDIARYEQMHDKFSPQPEKDQSTKSNIDFRRNILIGQFFTASFPDVKYFQPKLNQAASDEEFKLFADFLEKISKLKTVQKAWSQTIENKRTMNKATVSGEENGANM